MSTELELADEDEKIQYESEIPLKAKAKTQ